MIGQTAIAIALIGFNVLGRSVTPTFLSRYRLYLQYYFHIVQKWTKNQCGELKKIQDFCPRDKGSCHLAPEIMIVTCELVLWGTSPVDWISLIGPFKPYFGRENFPSKLYLIAILWDLQPLWSSSLTKCNLLRFRCSSGHVLSKTKSVTPQFFYISGIANLSSFNGKLFRKK